MIVNDTGFAWGHAHCFRLREELFAAYGDLEVSVASETTGDVWRARACGSTRRRRRRG